MATGLKGTELGILVDEFNFDGATSQIDVALTVAEADATNFASTALEYVPLLGTGKITQNGYWYGKDAGTYARELRDRLGTTGSTVTVLIGKSTVNCKTVSILDSYNAEMKISAPTANLMTLNGNWGTTSGLVGGMRVKSGVVSATGDGTAYDIGSAGSAGGYAILHVTAITGTATSASIKIQSSATEGGTYADEATITFSTVGSYTAVMTGTVNRWLKASVVSLGGATNFTCSLIGCVAGVTY